MKASAKMVRAAWIAASLLLLAGCHVDMWNQPKYKPQDESELFPDRQADRPLVTGTVPRRERPWSDDTTGYVTATGGRQDDAFYTGYQGKNLVTTVPAQAMRRFDNDTKALLRRGQYQYNNFCLPCHGRSGDGRGMITQRGLGQRRMPRNFHSREMRDIEIGHFYDVITNGFGVMFSYASRIDPEDRWAIAAYVRALQLSQNARPEDLPAEERQRLMQPGAAQTGGGGGAAGAANAHGGTTSQ